MSLEDAVRAAVPRATTPAERIPTGSPVRLAAYLLLTGGAIALLALAGRGATRRAERAATIAHAGVVLDSLTQTLAAAGPDETVVLADSVTAMIHETGTLLGLPRSGAAVRAVEAEAGPAFSGAASQRRTAGARRWPRRLGQAADRAVSAAVTRALWHLRQPALLDAAQAVALGEVVQRGAARIETRVALAGAVAVALGHAGRADATRSAASRAATVALLERALPLAGTTAERTALLTHLRHLRTLADSAAADRAVPILRTTAGAGVDPVVARAVVYALARADVAARIDPRGAPGDRGTVLRLTIDGVPAAAAGVLVADRALRAQVGAAGVQAIELRSRRLGVTDVAVDAATGTLGPVRPRPQASHGGLRP